MSATVKNCAMLMPSRGGISLLFCSICTLLIAAPSQLGFILLPYGHPSKTSCALVSGQFGFLNDCVTNQKIQTDPQPCVAARRGPPAASPDSRNICVWYHPPAVIVRRDSNPSHSTLESFLCEGEHAMSELVTKSVAQEQPGQKIETRTAAQRVAGFTVVVTAVVVLAVLVATAVYAQDKYSLKSPSGIAFSDFKGYEDWAVVSSARTDEVLKVIVANPVMIKAYKAGVPGNGQPFPEGSKIAKLQWSFKKSAEAPFVVDVPDAPTQAFLIEKDSKRFPKTGGWGYALFNHDVAAGKMVVDPATADCGHACHVAVKTKNYIFHPYQKR